MRIILQGQDIAAAPARRRGRGNSCARSAGRDKELENGHCIHVLVEIRPQYGQLIKVCEQRARRGRSQRINGHEASGHLYYV